MNTVALLEKLIACESISPHDAGCMDILQRELTHLGFECTRLDHEGVTNLWARIGTAAPLFVFAGHTDVVPAGDLKQWETNPFTLTERDSYIYGRGTQDMKGALACMVTAAADFLKAHPTFNGSIGFLLTSGEEGEDYLKGTPHILRHLHQTKETIDYCLVGEPSCTKKLGDTLRVGRRGSLHGHLTVRGKQDHVAYGAPRDNPIHKALGALDELTNTLWDEGHPAFPPTTLHISNIHSGTGSLNVIPSEVNVSFNLRYNPSSQHESIKSLAHEIFDAHALDYQLDWVVSGEPFFTETGTLIEALIDSIQTHTDCVPKLCTGGGTSDARFIAQTGCEVVEFGVLNDRIHQINERITLESLTQLSQIYTSLLEKILV